MTTTNANQTVVVTGGATGIGYAVAEQFLQRGANVVINGRTKANSPLRPNSSAIPTASAS